MVATPGWYPDPSGAPGTLRYWDGQTWSGQTMPAGTVPAGTVPAKTGPAKTGPAKTGPAKTGPWLIGLAALVLAVVVIVVLVVRYSGSDAEVPTGPVSGAPAEPSSGAPSEPGGRETSTQVCPEADDASAAPQPGDGRVHAGTLSYPQLGSPWSRPRPNGGVAFGRRVVIQQVETERSKAGQPWYAGLLIGELVAGDGFFSPQDGAAVVVKCVVGTFYGGAAVTRNDERNEAITVDGHDGWVIESQLGYDMPGITAHRELLIVVVVDTGSGPAGLFYGSVPENAAPSLVPAVRKSLESLRVDG